MLDIYHFVKDEQSNKPKKVVDRTQEKGFEKVWSLFKQWKKDSPDKKIRIYSAYSQAVQPIATELRRGVHDESPAPFAAFNNKSDKADGKYSDLSNGYEIYNFDKSISIGSSSC